MGAPQHRRSNGSVLDGRPPGSGPAGHGGRTGAAGNGAWACDLRLDGPLWMVGMVRDALGRALDGRHSPDFSDTARLLATEIVSNALRHGGGPVGVRLDGRACGLRCAAVDQGPPGPGPVVRPAGEGDEGGRGLRLVDAWSTKWGVEGGPGGVGTRVWFELVEHTCADETRCADPFARPAADRSAGDAATPARG
ncbi:ATP-binding protein [Streptomyces sp. NPDC001941]|uniref:ATP-binding protein n=1 Tax=Streptomyces sp. NPDC001941 TaxID=3154659 RepID=UPI003329AA58